MPVFRHRLWAAWAFFGLAVVLAVGWPVAAIVNWDDIVSSHGGSATWSGTSAS